MQYKEIGNTGLMLPEVVFGTANLGNLFKIWPQEDKVAIIRALMDHFDGPMALDSAGKYGAGLSLEAIGQALQELGVAPENVVISNKLAWRRVPLTTPEPTFEPGAWLGLAHDAVQDISYEGIIRCWEEGNGLLGGDYPTQMVSVHDPDEYLDRAENEDERKQNFEDILGAYRALQELKDQGKVNAIGVGAKDWTSIYEITRVVDLDWIMFANSMTLYSHPAELLAFMDELQAKNVAIINSAVFNAGFLTGGEFFNYRKLDPNDAEDKKLFQWREQFFSLCARFDVSPASACIQFGKSHPGVSSIAVSTSKPERVPQNIAMVNTPLSDEFWAAIKEEGLLAADYPHIG
ncbi:MAG: aldo/keto reductase [Chloroflexota bacterium]